VMCIEMSRQPIAVFEQLFVQSISSVCGSRDEQAVHVMAY
jgi:hypothetical protein